MSIHAFILFIKFDYPTNGPYDAKCVKQFILFHDFLKLSTIRSGKKNHPLNFEVTL